MTTVGFELTTSATPPSTALSVTYTNCAIETTPKIVRIAQLMQYTSYIESFLMRRIYTNITNIKHSKYNDV